MARLSRFVSNMFRRHRRGQSLVEFTLMLPVLLILISGVIEFGFMLNNYLDLLDAARDIARVAADDDPVHDEVGRFEDSPEVKPEPFGFYYRAIQAMATFTTASGRVQLLQANGDDMVLSIFRVTAGGSVTRHPPSYIATGALGDACIDRPQGEELGWRFFCNQSSAFTRDEVLGMIDTTAPSTSYVLVELYYNYNMTLGLPWIRLFVPDPVLLHAYTIVPNARATP